MKVKEFHINKLCRDKTDQLSSSELVPCREIFPTFGAATGNTGSNRHAQNKPKPNPMKNKITIKKKIQKNPGRVRRKIGIFYFYFLF